MNEFDIYYSAFKKYRTVTLDNSLCQRKSKVIKAANKEDELLEVKKYLCIIDESWVKEIETELEFVEKAVLENRQFIKSEGEVVPIEKVKKVSTESVRHLAKHSNLITRIPEGEDVIPDQIYMVEKLNEYAIYENRFLYMLISYLRDFINLRLEKIQTLRRTYDGILNINKKIREKNELDFTLTLHEKRIDSPYPTDDDKSLDLIKRIENIQQFVIMLLNTELMVQVSKAPMLKPPIIKTNVLKMNNNFKRSLALYNYLASFKGDGYEVVEIVKKFNPFTDLISDEFSEVVNLSTFLTFKIGNELEEVLEREYLEEQKRLKEVEAKRLRDYIARLKKRLSEDGSCIEEYIDALEKRNKMLEADSEELKLVRLEVIRLNGVIEDLNKQIEELNNRIEELKGIIEEKIQEIIRINKEHAEEIIRINNAHAEEINNLNKLHQDEVDTLNLNHQNELNEKDRLHQEELTNVINKYEEDIEKLNREITLKFAQAMLELDEDLKRAQEEYDRLVSEKDAVISKLQSDCDEAFKLRDKVLEEFENKITEVSNKYEDEIDSLTNKYETEIESLNDKVNNLSDENDLTRAEITTLKIMNGKIKPSVELSTQERFEQLEEEFLIFSKFFRKQWDITKKEIRKQILWVERENKTKGSDK